MIDSILDGIGDWLQRTFLGSLFGDLNGASLTFLVLGIIGLLLLVASIILDGLLDIFDFGGDGFLSITTISAFITVFGFAGLISSSAGLETGLSSLIGAASGVVGAILSILLTRAIKKIEGGSSIEETSLEGLTGIVTIPIPEDGLGEITLIAKGERYHISARSNTPVKQGQEVIIKTMISSTNALVIVKE